MPTVGDIKTFLEGEFEPIPILQDTSVERSVEEALRKWNTKHGVVRVEEYDNQDVIDLNIPETVRSVMEVLPSELDSLSDFGPSEEFGRDVLAMGVTSGSLGTNFIDAQNQLINYIQARDLLASIETFHGSDPAFRLEDGTLYLDNFDQFDATKVTVFMRVEIPNNDSYEINDTDAYDWIQDYAKGALMVRQGRILQKSDIADIPAGGGNLRDDGKELKQRKEEELNDQRQVFL
jgi:hypothetical protein